MQSMNANFAIPLPMASGPGVARDFNVAYVLSVIRRGWRWPLTGLLVGAIAGLTFLALYPSQYKSSARILIDQSVNRYLQANKIIDEPMLDMGEAGSQIYILTSESIIVPVVRSLNLARDPEFVGPLEPVDTEERWNFKTAIQAIQDLAGFGRVATDASEEMLERRAVEAVLKRLTVQREDVQNVISVTFASESSEKSSEIANAIADKYLEVTKDSKSQSTKLASQVLAERLVELKQQATDAERLLQEFKVAHDLTAIGLAADTDQFSTLNKQLTLARAAVAEAKARLDLFQEPRKSGDEVAQVTDNSVILSLRTQYFDYAAKLSELESRVGKKHGAVNTVKRRMDEIRSAIDVEKLRIAESYASEYQLAKARSDELASALSQMSSGVASAEADSQARAKMSELESAAQTLRGSYNDVLLRFNAIGKNDEAFAQNTRIITRAAPPLQKASSKGLMILGGSLALGLVLGVGAAVGRELLSGVIRTPSQIKEITKAYCAILPIADAAGSFGLGTESGQGGLLEEHVLDAPFSRFAEAFRNVRVVLLARQEPSRGNVICIVSAVAKEGKTTVATNLGALMASSSSQRVLVIDGDLHRRSLTSKLAPNARKGLLEALEDPDQLASLVVKRERSGIDVLPCPLASRLPNAAELLGSRQMETLIEFAREKYDFIIIEAPPIMSVVDVKVIERHVDQFVFVVEWGFTEQRLVQEALLEADGVDERLACVILNKVDPKVLKSIEAYKGPRLGEYYAG
jgi:succinoglycan biosynthesis transport protein ExoP